MFSRTRTRGCATDPKHTVRSQKIPVSSADKNSPKQTEEQQTGSQTHHRPHVHQKVLCSDSFFPLTLVPAAVGEVTVSNNGQMDFLSVSWRPAPGEVDSYLVSLSDRDRTLHTVSVSKSSPECVFNSLVSGRLYNISISSRSGQYQNHTFIQERTRECCTNTAKRQSPYPQHMHNMPLSNRGRQSFIK